MSVRTIFAAALVVGALAGSAPRALAHPDDDAFLPALPRHAPAGVCYARVHAGARWTPPGPARARWRLSPPPPGAPGPVWCLVEEAGAPPVLLEAERFGWIRVLCDGDATPARIGALQRRLHARGLYEGEYSGRYDAATVAAVRRFQVERHLEGVGHLSLRTLAALEESGAPSPLAALGPVAAVAPPPPPPPVVTIAVPAPPPPVSPWLSWPGKSRY